MPFALPLLEVEIKHILLRQDGFVSRSRMELFERFMHTLPQKSLNALRLNTNALHILKSILARALLKS
jgi:hypothetical protein